MERPQTMAVFAAFSAELESIGAGIEGLAGLVAAHAHQAPPELRPQVLVQAQALDDLTQRLAALSTLATVLAGGEAIETGLDQVPLSELADRMRDGVLQSGPKARSRQSAGDLMLFD